MQETQIPSLGWEDPLEKGMAIHTIAWRIPWTEDPDRLNCSQTLCKYSVLPRFHFASVRVLRVGTKGLYVFFKGTWGNHSCVRSGVGNWLGEILDTSSFIYWGLYNLYHFIRGFHEKEGREGGRKERNLIDTLLDNEGVNVNKKFEFGIEKHQYWGLHDRKYKK